MQKILGKSVAAWTQQYPQLADVMACQETAWFNPALAPAAVALRDTALTLADIDDAAARLARFAPYLAHVFPELVATKGIIESPLRAIPNMKAALDPALAGDLWLKCDSQLPISGSIKARGGVYEVLHHAEKIAFAAGILAEGDDYRILADPEARRLFSQHRIAVGSTGNLGLSIGIMGAKLGFGVDVHMSADARSWKKDLLRSRGVIVHEYQSDYSVAVAAGRQAAAKDPLVYFIDDENSINLFLGYAVAARRFGLQCAEAGITVDADHRLFVYLPCGVGGGPGGVAFGLATVFGDAVHCFFAEPTHSPCMFLGVLTGLHDQISVHDFGLDNRTAADGLAVGRPSGFVSKAMSRLINGCYTITDDRLFWLLRLLHDQEGIDVEPSAAAGFLGPSVVTNNLAYQHRLGISEEHLARATHVVWATGGSMVPRAEMDSYLARGASGRASFQLF
ncbi:MAG: D-serine ammonia-lyase [Propionibacteriaceae bacterium]